MKVPHELTGKRVRINQDVEFASGETIKTGSKGTIKYAEIALTLAFMVKIDGAKGGIFPGARCFTRNQFEVIE